MTAPAGNGSPVAAGGPIAGRAFGSAPPPNPKIQAVTFALELAKIRATIATSPERETNVQQLIDDAREISKFIGAASQFNSVG